jgi:hypothetical protein
MYNRFVIVLNLLRVEQTFDDTQSSVPQTARGGKFLPHGSITTQTPAAS